MPSAQAPIGVFDSGVGGLSVLRALLRELPNESYAYIADSANCPYGSRTAEEIRAHADPAFHETLMQRCVGAPGDRDARAMLEAWLRKIQTAYQYEQVP